MSLQQAVQEPLSSGEGPSSPTVAELVETVLNKGVVIETQSQASVIGIALIDIDARIVVVSIDLMADAYLRYADAVNRLESPQKAVRSGRSYERRERRGRRASRK